MDFDESKHPRDRFGQFTQKGLGHLKEHPPVGAKSLPNRRFIGFESPIKNEARSLGIEIRENDRLSVIKEKIQEAKEKAIDLTNDSKLKDFMAEEKKKNPKRNDREIISDYILKEIGDKYKMQDGLQVYLDHRDRLKIANSLKNYHPEQISHIKELIDNAELDHANKSYKQKEEKFSEYKYYLTRAKYKDDVIALWINVGLTRNDKTWHIYDITNYEPNIKR